MVGRCLAGTIAGFIAGVIAFAAAFEAQNYVWGFQGPVQARVGDARGLSFLANVTWLAGVPSLVAGCIAGAIAAPPNNRMKYLVVPACIGVVVGFLITVLVWYSLRGVDAQGPNPVFFAGFGIGALTAAASAQVRP